MRRKIKRLLSYSLRLWKIRLQWSFGEVCIKELHRPMCLSLSCHAEADLGSKGRKVRAHLLQATSLFRQKNEQRPQTHHYKASHRGQRPKLKQSFFLYTHLLQVNVPSPTSHHGGFRFINLGWGNLYNPEVKQAFPKWHVNTFCPCSKRKIWKTQYASIPFSITFSPLLQACL